MSETDPRLAAVAVVMDAYERDRLPFLALAFLGILDGDRLRDLAPPEDDPVARILAATPAPSPAYERTNALPRMQRAPVSPVDVARWRSSREWPDASEARSRFALWMESGEPFHPDVLSNERG